MHPETTADSPRCDRLAGAFSVSAAGDLVRTLLLAQGVTARAVLCSAGDDVGPEPLGGAPASISVGIGGPPQSAGSALARTSAAGRLGVVAVGGLANASSLTQGLLSDGAVMHDGGLSDLLMQLVAGSRQSTLVNRVVDALLSLQGGYALLLVAPDRMVAACDPWGLRTLAVGQLDGGVLICSDPAALRSLEATHVRPLAPGELLIADPSGVSSVRPLPRQPLTSCALAPSWLLREDGTQHGQSVYISRRRLGELVATVKPVSADGIVHGSTRSLPAALGYSAIAGAPLCPALLARAIDPERGQPGGVTHRFTAVPALTAHQELVLVTSGLLTGGRTRAQVRALRAAGARAVHLRVAAPPITRTCAFGLRIPPRHELISAHLSPSEICSYLNVDSVAWVPEGGLHDALGVAAAQLCRGCTAGQTPMPLEEDAQRHQLPLFRGNAPGAV